MMTQREAVDAGASPPHVATDHEGLGKLIGTVETVPMRGPKGRAVWACSRFSHEAESTSSPGVTLLWEAPGAP